MNHILIIHRCLRQICAIICGQDSGRRSVQNKVSNLHMCFPQGATRSEPSVEHIKIKLVTKKTQKTEAPSPDFTIVIVCDGKHHYFGTGFIYSIFSGLEPESALQLLRLITTFPAARR